MAKLEFIGPVSNRNGKNFRAVKIDGVEYSAWDRIAADLDNWHVGDECSTKISENGKYLNGIYRAGGARTGGSATGARPYSGGGSGKSWVPDPEKDAGVYTRYAMDAILQGKFKEIPDAVDFVFNIRKAVKKKLAGEKEAVEEGEEIKVKAASELLAKAGVPITPAVSTYIKARIKEADGFNKFTIDVQAIAEGLKSIVFKADGTPQLINNE